MTTYPPQFQTNFNDPHKFMTARPKSILRIANGEERVFLHDSLPSDTGSATPVDRGSILFSEPERTITCWMADDIQPAIEAVEQALGDGLYVAGAFAYEFGYFLEDRLKALAPAAEGPLFQVGVFREMDRLTPVESENWSARQGSPPSPTNIAGSGIRVNLSRTAYDDAIARLHQYILAGDVYQANFTFPINFLWPGDVWHLYHELVQHQKVAYGAVVDLPELKVASLSPELFFQKRGRVVTCQPMKGTMRRGRTADEDRRLAAALQADPKNRAENLMIVDLIRNDLGRLARIGSVRVEAMFQVETFTTLHQMISTVSAEMDGELSLLDIFRRLFPCGSVTGAPKIRAMEIISELENTARGVYTGAVGYITPGRDMCFSVPIRTVTLNFEGEATLGVGSGVVADSVSENEYEECLLKAQFLTNALSIQQSRPGLIETMAAVDGTIPLIDDHRERLNNSAEILGICFSPDRLWQEVATHVGMTTGEHRVRVQLEADGNWEIVSARLGRAFNQRPIVIVSSERLQSGNPLLAHKTTQRKLHDRARAALDSVENGFDVLLFNERHELCEGGISNIFLELDGKLVTPALECGLLPGIGRALVIKEQNAEERVLYEDDLRRAGRVYLSNAVRGLFEVEVLE